MVGGLAHTLVSQAAEVSCLLPIILHLVMGKFILFPESISVNEIIVSPVKIVNEVIVHASIKNNSISYPIWANS